MPAKTKTNTVHIATRVHPADLDAMEQAAFECGLPLGTWLRTVALAAAGVSPLGEQIDRAKKAGAK